MDRRYFLAGSAASLSLAHPKFGHAQGQTSLSAASRFNPEAPLRGLVPDGCQANLAPLIADWTGATGQEVDLVITSVDDINTRMTLDQLSGTTDYDFALPATFGLADLVWANAIRPLDAVEASLGADLATSQPLYAHGNKFNGKTYGFQTDGDVYLMFYRRELLQSAANRDAYAGVYGTQLGLPTSWSELDQQMAFFHRPEEGQYGGALFRLAGYLGWEFLARFRAKGGQVFDAELQPQFMSDPAREALEEMLRASEHLHPAAGSAGLFENWRLYKDETIYANIGWGGSQKAFHAPGSPLRDGLLYGDLPGPNQGSKSYFNWGWSYVVPTVSTQPELAYLFARHATAPEGSTRAVREAGGYFDPFLAVHYDDPAIQDTYGKAFLEVHKKAMAQAGPDMYLPGYGSYLATLNEHLAGVFNGALTPADGLQRVTSDWRLITLDFDFEGQKARWRDLSKNI